MTEFEEIRNKRQDFLKVVYDLAEGAPSTDVSGEDIARHLGLDLYHHWDKFSKLADPHERTGNIEILESMYGTSSITIKGIEEVERLTPQESRIEKRIRFLRAVYELSGGNLSELVDWEDIAPGLGWEIENFEHKEQGLGIAKYLTARGFLTLQGDGSRYTITAAGIDEVEQEPDIPADIAVTPGLCRLP